MVSNLETPLHSVGVVIFDSSQNLLLQKRDQKDSIYFPGLWGLFGGACDSCEPPKKAAFREIEEELSIHLEEMNFFLCLNIKTPDLGGGLRTRFFYSAEISEDAKLKIFLSEGSEFKFFKKNDLPSIAEMVPFDLSALTLFYHLKIAPRAIKPLR